MTYSPFQIANFYINKSHATGVELTPMKLLKLVYLAHGGYMGLNGQPLLDEVVYGWKYGPVIKSLYAAFKEYGRAQIDHLYKDSEANVPLPDESVHPFLEKIWEIYKDRNGIQLSALTHQKNTPWDIIWNQHDKTSRKDQIIPNDIIKHYYSQLVLSARSA